jgi:hypothetical protein
MLPEVRLLHNSYYVPPWADYVSPHRPSGPVIVAPRGGLCIGLNHQRAGAIPTDLRPVRLSGTENRHKAIQKSHAEVGFLGGLRRPST